MYYNTVIKLHFTTNLSYCLLLYQTIIIFNITILTINIDQTRTLYYNAVIKLYFNTTTTTTLSYYLLLYQIIIVSIIIIIIIIIIVIFD